MISNKLQIGADRFVRSNIRFYLTTLCLVFTLTAMANPITREQAKQKAEKFLKTRKGNFQLSSVTSSLKLAPSQQPTATGQVQYYAFNRGFNQGYVLVAADDQIETVLGYTDQGEFDYQTIPDNMRAWLDGYADYIAYLQKTAEPVRKQVPTHPAIQPMMTTKWSQGAPYNNECPMYFTLGRSVTGCVATAMAQVLYFQRDKSVREVQKDIPSYTTWTEHSTYGKLNVEGIPAGSPIDWDNMIDDYGKGSTAKQQLAVAQLMHYCGVSVEMDYTNSASGANSYKVADAMKAYFGYGSSVRYLNGSSYSDTDWDAIIYSELEQGRVVYLSGANSDAGHAFVTDGYDGNHCFHINWGWGGMSDGFFLLSSLNPSSQGIGGSGDGYSQYPEAVIGCEPENYGEKEIPIANATVKRLCVANFDADGDGVFTYGEAAMVTDLGTVFTGQRINTFTELYYFTGLTAIAESAFSGCTTLATIKLPKALKSIGAYAFNGCRALKSFKVPDGLTTIGKGAFAGCRALDNLTLPTGLTAIPDSTFAGCAAFTAVDLPLTVQSIGAQAFAGCTKLANFSVKTFSPQNIAMGDNVFENIDLSEATLNVMQGTKSYYQSTPQWKEFGNIFEERTLSGGEFADLATNTSLYILNEGTGRYLSMGEAWGTQAIVSDSPMRFQLRRSNNMPEGVYYIYCVDNSQNGHILFRTSNDNNVGIGVAACFVDGDNAHLTDKTAYWKVESVGDKVYTIQIPSEQNGYKAEQFWGVQLDHASNIVSPTYGAYSDVTYAASPVNCQWRFVIYDQQKTVYFEAIKTLENLLQSAKKKHVDHAFEQAVYDNMDCTLEQILAAQHTLRKKLRLIEFKDDELRQVCAKYYDVDGDGEVSFSEANKVSDFGYAVFDNHQFTDLTDLQYFPNVVYIYGNSFQNCKNLHSVILPKSLQAIYYQVFQNCSKLTSISLPQSITLLGEKAFAGCTSLKSVTVMNPNPFDISVGDGLFEGVPLKDATLYVPAGSKDLYAKADTWKEFGKIVEVRGNTKVKFSPIEPNVNGYIYNIADHQYINQGEAWGTQAVVDYSGFVYQFRTNKNLPEGVYYLYSNDAGGSHVLFRTSTDSKVGTGVKACFVDGSEGTSAYWQIEQNQEDLTFTMQVPKNDATYTEGEYFGTQHDHASETSPWGTSGIYWDVVPGDSPQNIQWAFIRQSDINAAEQFDELVATLGKLLDKATVKAIDHTAEQAVYDDFNSGEEQIRGAIDSLRKKLGYIEFSDLRAKSLCTNNWDTDDDGELTYEEAAAVTDIGTTFSNAVGLKSLDELRYFTSITSIPENAFNNSSSLVSLYIPENVSNIGDKAFASCSALKYVAMLSSEAVVKSGNSSLSHNAVLFVPKALIASYQADETWSKNTIVEYTGIPTVTADDGSREYGRTFNKYSFTVTGAPIDGEPTCAYEPLINEETGEELAEAQMPVGQYPIIISQGTITTPGLVLVNGTLTVEPAELTITAKSYTRNIGEENPEFEITYKGFRNREKADQAFTLLPTVECEATADSPGGEYEIRVTGGVAPNYTLVYVNGTLTVIDPVGINGVAAGEDEGKIYDLQGRPVSKPTTRGIYIINGKKKAVGVKR